MKRPLTTRNALGLPLLLAALILAAGTLPSCDRWQGQGPESEETTPNALAALPELELSEPLVGSDFTLETAMLGRRSVREYREEPIGEQDLSRLLWSLQGVSDESRGFRTVPSAGALYPLSVYVIAERVDGLPPGGYRYDPDSHSLTMVFEESHAEAVYEAALSQAPVSQAAALFLIAADYGITEERYGDRAERYVHLEAGHAGQNLSLMAVACDLSTVPIGAFDDEAIGEAFGLMEDQIPLYLFPVGVPES